MGIEDCGKLDSTYLTTTVTRKTPTKIPMEKYPRKHCGVVRVYIIGLTRKTIGREPGGHPRVVVNLTELT